MQFLRHNQLPTGEFRTLLSDDREMRAGGTHYGSPFVSALVVYSTGWLRERQVETLHRNALVFLVQERLPRGEWAIWASGNTLQDLVPPLPPDLDCTAVIAQALTAHGIPTPASRETVLGNRDVQGVFSTFLVPLDDPWPDTCGIVNANVVFYLGGGAETEGACAFLNDIVARHAERECSQWCNGDPLPF